MIAFDFDIYTGSCPTHPHFVYGQSVLLYHKNGPYVRGLGYPVGTEGRIICNLTPRNRIVYHPTICQPNGTWEPPSRCEGIRSADLN